MSRTAAMYATLLLSIFGIGILPQGQAAAQSLAGNPIPVTVDNFIRAESDMYLGASAKEAGGIGKLFHRREPVAIDKQPVIRANRDTRPTAGLL